MKCLIDSRSAAPQGRVGKDKMSHLKRQAANIVGFHPTRSYGDNLAAMQERADDEADRDDDQFNDACERVGELLRADVTAALLSDKPALIDAANELQDGTIRHKSIPVRSCVDEALTEPECFDLLMQLLALPEAQALREWIAAYHSQSNTEAMVKGGAK